MSNSTLRIFYILGFISIIGLFSVQVYWFKKAFDKSEFEFERSLTIALDETVKDLLKYNNTNTVPVDPVKQLDNNYYAIMVNDQIHADVLEFYLKTEFDKFNIHQGYEYRIYDCQNKEMKFGGYVDGKAYTNEVIKNRKLPLLKEDNYYFTVYFPHKSMDIIKSMELWIFSSIILFIVIAFFSYSLFVIFKQKRFSEIQKDFINNMSHEIKTPLSVISASAETLKNADEIIHSNRLLKYSLIILEESNRLKNQIERVLNVSHSERIIKLNTQKIDLIPLFNQLLEQFKKNTETTFSYNIISNEKNVWANIDKEYFESAIYNIIENSIKYSNNNLALNISFNVTNEISISIQDNGIGIDKKHLAKIFDKFYRVPTGNVHNIKGFGIGLNFVKQIIKLHKGNIQVESVLNQGSTFIIRLPKINTIE